MSAKKRISTRLKAIADNLPVVKYRTFYKQIVPGLYLLPGTIVRKQTTGVVNHKRRMKKLFKKYGLAGVNSYIIAVGNLKENIV
jgi:hypothetical protein